MHRDRALIRSTADHVLVLCPLGHLVTNVRQADWAGSYAEARAGSGWDVTCEGAVPEQPHPDQHEG